MPLYGDKKRQYESERSRQASRDNAEIGPPPPRNEELWERYRFNLYRYLVEMFPHSTGLKPLSVSHRRAIDRIQQIILEGGQELIIVFRGWAKSTITELSATWAAGYGHRQFFVPIGANDEMATTALDSIQSEFETNDNLMEIFPEVCHAARALEGVAQRAGKQTINGNLTRIEWTGERCVLPTVDGFPGSGAIIWPKGITANLRGMRFKRPDGTQARPDFVMGDDLQTDESAASPSQVNKRISKINKTILRLGGHNKRMACVINGTIIEPDDVIDRLSNHKLYPSWRATKVPMLLSFSKVHESHWLGTYADLRTTHNPEDDEDIKRAHAEANAYLQTHWDVMHEGSQASWEYCYVDGDELSAVHHAYNILIDTSYDAFMAECQNEPVRNSSGLQMLTPEQICMKQSGYSRDQFPAECTVLTCFIDVHPSILYWTVWAWEPSFTGYCINYGTFPDQGRKYFAHNQLSRRLQNWFPNMDTDATVTAGLGGLVHGYEQQNWTGLLRREWIRGDGVPMKIGRCGIDANGEAADAVKKFIRQSEFSAILFASYGTGKGAKSTPMSQWQQAKKKDCGWPECVPVKGRPGEPQGYMFETNYAATRFHRALALPDGGRGSLYLYKVDRPNDHRLVADHWSAEKPTEVTANGRTVNEFAVKPGADNHYQDCARGCMVAAGLSGISSLQKGKSRTVTKSLSEWAQAAKGR